MIMSLAALDNRTSTSRKCESVINTKKRCAEKVQSLAADVLHNFGNLRNEHVGQSYGGVYEAYYGKR